MHHRNICSYPILIFHHTSDFITLISGTWQNMSLEYGGTWKNMVEHGRTLRNRAEHNGTWQKMHFGAWWNMAEHVGTWRNMAEHVFRNMTEHGGTWRNMYSRTCVPKNVFWNMADHSGKWGNKEEKKSEHGGSWYREWDLESFVVYLCVLTNEKTCLVYES